MKTRVLIFTIMLIQLTALFADYKNYKMELVHTFKDDYNIEDLETTMSSFQSNGPSAFSFDGEGNLYVIDSLQRRFVVYTSDFKYLSHNNASKFYSMSRIKLEGNKILGSTDKLFLEANFNGDLSFYINIDRMKAFNKVSFNKYFTFEDNIVTLSTRKGDVYKLKNPGVDNEYNEKNLKKVGNISSMSKSARSVVSDTEFISSYHNFIEGNKSEPEVTKSRMIDVSVMSINDINIISPTTMEFIGLDSDGNYYWNDDYKHIIIFNTHKQLIDAFNFDIEHVQIDPVVHPSGDVYFMDIYEEGVDLYRVKRVW